MSNFHSPSDGASAGGLPPRNASLTHIIDALVDDCRARSRAALGEVAVDARAGSSDAFDEELDAVLDRAVQDPGSQDDAALIESVYASIPVECVRVTADPLIGPRAWRAEYVITDAANSDPLARPPIEHFAIVRSDREGPAINAAELDVLAFELDTLAADPSVLWECTSSDGPDGARIFSLASAIGVSGSPRDRLLVELRVSLRLRAVLDAPIERLLGLLYRLLDTGAARIEL